MRIDEFEFQDRNGNEIEPTKNQLVVYIKSLHKQIAELKKQLEEKDKEIAELEEITDSIVSTAYYKLARTDEIIKLKAQLHSQPAEIVEKIREFCLTDNKFKECEIYLREDNGKTIYSFLDDILKEYQK